LSRDTDPKRLQDYEILWSREFLSRPPKEHDAERALIVQDLKRLETLNPQGDAAWRALLISGYRQSGASAETLTTLENSLIRDFPHSLQADNIVNERWNDAHPQPTGQNDAAAWARYYSEKEDAVRRWMRDYPDDTFLQRCDLFDLAKEDDAISEKDGIAALDIYLQALKDYKNRGMWMYEEYEPAELLLDHGWQTERALELLKETPTIKGNGHLPLNLGDNLSKSDETRFDSFRTEEDQHTIGLLLKAAILTDEPEEAMKLRAAIESQLPADKKLQSEYWWNRARFETLQKHTHQALADYRLALDSRTETPQPNHGRVQDQLTDEAHALFIAQGGTERDWTAWKGSRHNATESTASSEWKKPTDPMPSFELSDFSGRIWRLKDLAGKTVLVSAWATWCGPCRLELVFLENFYERVKDRPDIQVLTLNIDEDPGLVQPFMKQKGYTFPVLSAASLAEVQDLIPRTWVVNSRGAWLWVKDGFDDQKSEAQFDKDLLDRIDAVNSGK
jgi:thiol-disulfide isomerase/thioredoxin